MKSKKGFKIFVFICVGLICVGIVFTGVGFLLGGSPNVSYNNDWSFGLGKSGGPALSGKTITANMDLEGIKKIEIYVGRTDVNFVESDKFEVEFCYDEKITPEAEMSNGTFTYRDNLYDTKWRKGFNNKNIFTYVTVYYPAGTKFDSVYVESNLGGLKADGLDTTIIEASLDVGEIDIRKIRAMKMEVGADVGDINISEAVTGAMDISADIGEINISGELNGYNSISGDVGDVSIETTLSEKDYNYEIDVDLGEVKINGMDVKKAYSQNNGAANSFELENSIGDIDVRFR